MIHIKAVAIGLGNALLPIPCWWSIDAWAEAYFTNRDKLN